MRGGSRAASAILTLPGSKCRSSGRSEGRGALLAFDPSMSVIQNKNYRPEYDYVSCNHEPGDGQLTGSSAHYFFIPRSAVNRGEFKGVERSVLLPTLTISQIMLRVGRTLVNRELVGHGSLRLLPPVTASPPTVAASPPTVAASPLTVSLLSFAPSCTAAYTCRVTETTPPKAR
jgi:hypothetical protein